MIYLPLFARVRGVLDHALYHDTYELSDVLQQYSQKFGALSDQESITGYLLDSLEATINLAAIAYVALPEGLDAGVMQVLEAGDIYARGQYATEEGKAYMLAGLARLPGNSEMLLRQRNAMRNPWHGCEALVLIESITGGAIAGLLVVGPKRSGRFASAQGSVTPGNRRPPCWDSIRECVVDTGPACFTRAGASSYQPVDGCSRGTATLAPRIGERRRT